MLDINLIFNLLFVKLTTFAYPYVKSEDIAKDVVQEAFIVLINKPEMMEKDFKLVKSFLYGTVRNLALEQGRKISINKRAQENLKTTESDDSNLLDALIDAETIGELHNGLNHLPSACQHICRLIYIEGMKYEEVAKELKISINTVKTQRMRAIKALKEKFNFLITIFF